MAVILEIATLIIPAGHGGWGHAGPKNVVFLLFYIMNLPGLLLLASFPPPFNIILAFGTQLFLVAWLFFLFFQARERKKMERAKNE